MKIKKTERRKRSMSCIAHTRRNLQTHTHTHTSCLFLVVVVVVFLLPSKVAPFSSGRQRKGNCAVVISTKRRQSSSFRFSIFRINFKNLLKMITTTISLIRKKENSVYRNHQRHST